MFRFIASLLILGLCVATASAQHHGGYHGGQSYGSYSAFRSIVYPFVPQSVIYAAPLYAQPVYVQPQAVVIQPQAYVAPAVVQPQYVQADCAQSVQALGSYLSSYSLPSYGTYGALGVTSYGYGRDRFFRDRAFVNTGVRQGIVTRAPVRVTVRR